MLIGLRFVYTRRDTDTLLAHPGTYQAHTSLTTQSDKGGGAVLPQHPASNLLSAVRPTSLRAAVALATNTGSDLEPKTSSPITQCKEGSLLEGLGSLWFYGGWEGRG